MSLINAKNRLDEIMSDIDQVNRKDLIEYAIRKWMSSAVKDNSAEDEDFDFHDGNDDVMEDPEAMLRAIIKDLQGKIGQFSATKANNHQSNKYPDDNEAENDEFLYNADSEDDLKGNACQKCGFESQLMNFKCSSFSQNDLYIIFNAFLPTLDGKTVLDIESRIGSSLYGAYCYTDAAKIIGLEMSDLYCKLQNEIIQKFHMQKRVQIHQKKITDCSDLLKTADVVIVNRIHLFNSDPAQIWDFLKAHVKKGAYIVSRPGIPKIFNDLKVNGWLKEVDKISDCEEKNTTVCYNVL